MKTVSLKIFIMILLTTLYACKTEIKNRSSLITYINDQSHGLKKTLHRSDVDISLTYEPWQLFVSKKQELKQRQKVGERRFFLLSLSQKNNEVLRQLDFKTYSNLVQVMGFKMIPLIKILPEKGDSFEPLDCIFQQTYGASSANELLIICDGQHFNEGEKFAITVDEFGLNTGKMRFEFEPDALRNLPTIKI